MKVKCIIQRFYLDSNVNKQLNHLKILDLKLFRDTTNFVVIVVVSFFLSFFKDVKVHVSHLILSVTEITELDAFTDFKPYSDTSQG